MTATSTAPRKPDASRRLAHAHDKARAAIDGPTATTPCDRCAGPLGDRIARLGRGDYGGIEQTWWICDACDYLLSQWWNEGRRLSRLGGTE